MGVERGDLGDVAPAFAALTLVWIRDALTWAEKNKKDGQGSYGFGAESLRRMLRARCSLISLWRGTG